MLQYDQILQYSHFELVTVLGVLEKEAKQRAKDAKSSFDLFAPSVSSEFMIEVGPDARSLASEIAQDSSSSSTSTSKSPASPPVAAPTPAVVVARLDGQLWELNRPVEGDCQVQFVSSEAAAGQSVMWHSSAHILGQAIEQVFPGKTVSPIIIISPPHQTNAQSSPHLSSLRL